MTEPPAPHATAPVTVAIDGAPMLGSRTGMGVAVAGLVGALARRDDVDVRTFGLTLLGWRDLSGVAPPGSGRGRAPMPAGPLMALWSRTSHPAVEWWTGPVDVVHGTNFVVPPARRAARLVTVADLTAVRFPQLVTATSRRYPGLVARAVAEGATVHTFAAFVAAEVVEHFGADPARVRVVPAGVDVPPPGRAPIPPPGRPYVLALGTVEPRKDLPGLVAAFELVARDHPDLELCIAGPDGWGAADLDAAIAAAACRDRIVRVGWVPDVDALLRGATLLAYPSRYEGFGLPPLEAMARGVPVVTTAAGAIPEVVGDAARLVPVGDVDALAEAIAEVVEDSALRARLVAAGRLRAAAFSWDAAAAAMAGIYRELAAG